mgnify:FL=1
MEEHSLHTNNQPLPTESEKMTTKEEVALRHHFLLTNTKQPDVEAELKRFKQKQQRLSTRQLIIVSNAITAAVLLGCIWLFQVLSGPNNSKEKELPETIFLADNSLTEITLQNQEGNHIELNQQTSADELSGIFGAQNDEQGRLDYRNNIRQEVSMQTVSTPRKKEFKLTLSDGTEVWLNAESQLSYPSRFKGNERIVHLQGEAYFKVAHDKQHPFIVYTENLHTQVLGTEFNIRNYPSSEALVTLINGQVKVKNRQNNLSKLLAPGEQACLNKEGDFSISHIDADEYVEWKDGYFYFDNKPLVEIMRDLGRWYNVDIIFIHPSDKNIRLHFLTKRHETLEQAITLLNSLNKVKASVKENKVIIE